ncbi:MAG: SWIM zinc finger family protein [Acidimicrobiales bacterium]|jgi:uncharacterized Zn finger protein|nr:SWIM zinc finger family protein [Acidimicrobiales bacterium]
MPGSDRYGSSWQRFPASKPIPVADGIATSKRRGAMAATWWSARFVDVLESYGLGARMQRGRRYARQGQVLSFEVRPGQLLAQVQGSRRTPYLVTVDAARPTTGQWEAVDAAMGARVGFVARLLTGEVPPDLEDVFVAASVRLFPDRWSDLHATCSCPDPENPCKHIAAVLYVFADRLDEDPWLLLLWRGRTRDQVLEPLRGRARRASREPSPASTTDADQLPPWWPPMTGRAGGQLDASGDTPDLAELLRAEPPDTPHAVLQRLEPLAVEVRGAPFTDLLAPAYEALVWHDSPGEVARRTHP